MGRAKRLFSKRSLDRRGNKVFFAVVRGPAFSNGMQATANIKPQSVLDYQAKICKKIWNRDKRREICTFFYFPLLRWKEPCHIIEHNIDISDWISCKTWRFDIAFFIVIMMRIGLQMAKFLFIVPAQNWKFGKELVSVVNVSLVVIDPCLELICSC